MPTFIEWIDGGRVQRGTLKKEDKAKLQVVSLTGRTMALKTNRAVLRHEAGGDAGDFFAAVDADAGEVDLELLHEAVEAGTVCTLAELAAQWFSAEAPSSRELSVILAACADGAPWFSLDASGKVQAATPDRIAQWNREREARARHASERDELLVILRGGLDGDGSEQPDEGGGPPSDGGDLARRAGERLLDHLCDERPLDDWKALDEAVREAAAADGIAHTMLIRRFLDRLGRLPPPYALHMRRFARAFLGKEHAGGDWEPGRNLYPAAPAEEIERVANDIREKLAGLPPALNGFVFSVDDETTEEIDDAVSAEEIDGGRIRVGVHIAAPGIFIPEESEIHRQAVARGTTVYQPDLKWTMLPREIIGLFSLREGRAVPALGTYCTFAADSFELLDTSVRLEAVEPAANFSYELIERELEGGFIPEMELLDEDPGRVHGWLEKDPRDFPWSRPGTLPDGAAAAVDLLVPLARRLFVNRFKEGAPLINRREFKIKASADGAVEISERRRNSLAEGMVSELMILTNNGSASLLAKAGMPAVYRTQRLLGPADGGGGGPRAKAGLTVNPHEHAGLGASFYCWSTSPLRRYADLINQRQLGTLAGGPLPAFRDESELLVRAKGMEFQNKAAFGHQRRLERYWTLRHMESLPDTPWPVVVERQDRRARLVFDTLPLILSLPLEEVSAPDGPARFTPEWFDFFELQVAGKCEPGA
jgi:exoribonuclease-2